MPKWFDFVSEVWYELFIDSDSARKLIIITRLDSENLIYTQALAFNVKSCRRFYDAQPQIEIFENL